MMNEKSKSRNGILLVVLLAGLMITLLNQTVINVALPQIMSRFQIDASTAQWLSSGYMLVVGILIPVSAYLIKRFTYKQLFTTAIALFTVGSLVCAVSPNFSILLAGRLLQAAGGGILMPLSMNIFMLVLVGSFLIATAFCIASASGHNPFSNAHSPAEVLAMILPVRSV